MKSSFGSASEIRNFIYVGVHGSPPYRAGTELRGIVTVVVPHVGVLLQGSSTGRLRVWLQLEGRQSTTWYQGMSQATKVSASQNHCNESLVLCEDLAALLGAAVCTGDRDASISHGIVAKRQSKRDGEEGEAGGTGATSTGVAESGAAAAGVEPQCDDGSPSGSVSTSLLRRRSSSSLDSTLITYSWQFALELPADLPASFEDDGTAVAGVGSLVLPTDSMSPKSFGSDKPYIRYVLSAFVGREPEGTGLNGADPSVLLSTWQPLMLAQAYAASTLRGGPLLYSASKEFWLAKGKVEVEAEVPYGGIFFASTGITLRIRVHNGTSRLSVTGVRLTLTDRIELHAQRSITPFTRQSIATTGDVPLSAPIAPGEHWAREPVLPLPGHLGPSLDAALVKRSFELRLDVSVAGGLFGVSLAFPVTVVGGVSVDLEGITKFA
eukprot:CAMPEP_0170751546 /NCGR_PEP_ID=MMETSP0437-20130122/11508_1 /TAXON_ID=0 /ORGANISM="Sexangularia sp." /LENGTH=436 /DNA_ID=CAMNT_0011090587 /DNA_START=33 /DNA_END=1343 /DNA_ORIENTATION=+